MQTPPINFKMNINNQPKKNIRNETKTKKSMHMIKLETRQQSVQYL